MCLPIAVMHPDLVLGEGEYLGYEWNIVMGPLGHRCGYVRVDKTHPWHEKDYSSIEVSVHGGLTFAEKDMDCGKGGADDGYWVGFDCAHAGDRADPELFHLTKFGKALAELGQKLEDQPEHIRYAYSGFPGSDYETVKSQDYVINECKSLIRQARKAARQLAK